MSDIYLGNTEIEKAYIGDTLIYEKGGGDSEGGSSDDYELMPFNTSSGSEFEAPLGEKNLLITIITINAKNVKVVNSSASKYFTYYIPAGKQYWFICEQNSNTVYVSAGTTTSIK